MALDHVWNFWVLVFGIAGVIAVLHFFAAAVMMAIRHGRRLDTWRGLKKALVIVAVLPMFALFVVLLLLATIPQTEVAIFCIAPVGVLVCLLLLLGVVLFIVDCYELAQLERHREADIQQEMARFRVKQNV